jgi:nitrate/TMAO reductase-like tetraheme cytochrome c subunit
MLKEGAIPERRKLYIDLNDQRHRNAFIIFSTVTFVLLILTSIGSYEAFHFTESVKFCGTLCHEVMEPEYTAYQNSPHANVTCVECHVGSGADWYVKSKLSGLHQVWAVLTDSFARPIATPLHDLRPARETCEKCHWPKKFYARTLRANKSFLADRENTEWDVLLQMKTGPEYSAMGLTEGIHWHINPDVSIEYISDGDKRENIAYVKYTNKSTGEVHIYRSEELPITDSVINSTAARTMDCIDCHNRPSHHYLSPPNYFDKAMISGLVPSKIPFIKKIAMRLLKEPFNDKDTALAYFDTEIRNYYLNEHPDYLNGDTLLLGKAIAGIQQVWSQNTFPRMKVTYDAYPDHIGHLETNGCFRCHNNQFKSETGRVISKDCNLCHTIIGQGNPGAMELTNVRDTLTFRHPVDIGNDWADYNCSECHRYLY